MRHLPVILLVLFSNENTLGNEAETVVSRPGHYPPIWCQVSDVVLSARDKAFIVDPVTDVHIGSTCKYINDIWPVEPSPKDREPLTCDKEFDEGHVFTIYYHYGSSNYYHLVFDMMIPLYQTLYHDIEEPPNNIALLPSVEASRMKEIDWETQAFGEPSKYWVQMVKLLISDGTTVLPLDRSLTNTSSNFCFKKLYFGTGKYNIQNEELLQGFAQYVKQKLYVLERPLTPDNLRIGLITRSSRRRILNEAQLIDAVRPFADVDLVRFEGLKIREQVALVQKYAIIVGVNGAGLTNAMFRPEHAVAIQLVPYQAEVNHETFGHLLSATGRYLVWHNRHKENHHQSVHDTNNNSADTVVHVEEFRSMIREAIVMVKDAILGVKDEL